jgi:hypothetical protein
MTLDTLLTIIGIVSTLSTLGGSFVALFIDFYRRRIRSKAADYTVQAQLERFSIAVETLQTTLEGHIKTSDKNHSEVCQRVARLEGKYSA